MTRAPFCTLSSRAPARLTLLVGCFVTALCALLAKVGADAGWLAALGRDIAQSWSIPGGVPFAAVPVGGLAQRARARRARVPRARGRAGDAWARVRAARRGGRVPGADLGGHAPRRGVPDAPAALVLILTAFAAAPALLVVRSQLFSLALFPLLLLLLRAEARRPSRRIWLLVPLVALWSNLHGGVLLGVAVAGAYLVFGRGREQPLVAGGVLAGMALALFATPALVETAAYYRGVLGSRAATHGEGLWQPLSLHAPFDVVFLVVAVPLLVLAVRSRPQLWEAVAMAGLAVAAVRSSRNEVWLALFVALPAARGLAGSRPWSVTLPRLAAGVTACLLAVVAISGLARTPTSSGATPALLERAAPRGGGTAILADGVDAEQLAVAGQENPDRQPARRVPAARAAALPRLARGAARRRRRAVAGPRRARRRRLRRAAPPRREARLSRACPGQARSALRARNRHASDAHA